MNYVDAEIIKDGTSYLVSDNTLTGASLEVLSFIARGIEKKHSNNDAIDGLHRLYQGGEDKYRKVFLRVKASYESIHDTAHLRDAVNELFDGEFIIREKRINNVEVAYETPGQKTGPLDLGESQYVNGKQLEVAHVGVIEIDDNDMAPVFDVELETVDLPYFESIYTTKELNDTGYDAMVEKYGLVDGIDTDHTQYVFASNNFDVWNAGNVKVEPESMDLKISIEGLTTDGNFELKNTTTGEAFKFKKAVTSKDITIDGMVVKESVYNALRDTNRQFISLSPGSNTFEVSGGIFDYAIINFKYYYR